MQRCHFSRRKVAQAQLAQVDCKLSRCWRWQRGLTLPLHIVETFS